MALAATSTVAGPSSVKLAWDPVPDVNVAGYKIYYGPISQNYTNIISVENETTATVQDLVRGATYFFAATTVDEIGLESGFSNEVSYTVPAAAPARLVVESTSDGRVLLKGSGESGQAYEIHSTSDLQSWRRVTTVTASADGKFEFADTAGSATRFYTLKENP